MCSKGLAVWCFRIGICVIALATMGCASRPGSPYSSECDISSLNASDYLRGTWCTVKHAALRCSTKSDKCLVQCELGGGAKHIGGGCQHLCSPGVYTEKDVAENGGSFTPPGATACANEGRR